jgi:hypothetical protein
MAQDGGQLNRDHTGGAREVCVADACCVDFHQRLVGTYETSLQVCRVRSNLMKSL